MHIPLDNLLNHSSIVVFSYVLLFFDFSTIIIINILIQIIVNILKHNEDDKGNKIKFGKINPCLYIYQYRLLPLRSRILSAEEKKSSVYTKIIIIKNIIIK